MEEHPRNVSLDRPLPGSRPSTREKLAEAGRATLLSRFEVGILSNFSRKHQYGSNVFCCRLIRLFKAQQEDARRTISGNLMASEF